MPAVIGWAISAFAGAAECQTDSEVRRGAPTALLGSHNCDKSEPPKLMAVPAGARADSGCGKCPLRGVNISMTLGFAARPACMRRAKSGTPAG